MYTRFLTLLYSQAETPTQPQGAFLNFLEPFIGAQNVASIEAVIAKGGLTLFKAAVFIFIGLYVAKVVHKFIANMFAKTQFDQTLAKFAGNFIYYLIVGFTLMAAAGVLGIDTTSFVALLGAAGLAIGFAVEGSLRNFAAGIVLIIMRPYKVDDYIEGAETFGKVEDIQLFNTIVVTLDNETVIIPNSELTGAKITNYSAKPYIDLEVPFVVPRETNFELLKSELNTIVNGNEIFLKRPAAELQYLEFLDYGLKIQFEVPVKPEDKEEAGFIMIEEVNKMLLKQNIPTANKVVKMVNA